ncbi:Mu-like prophage DNA circulation protein [Tistlia consotensis]|uniref:Mu-like prophage DNA circulation protein n=1 Tax=Tistlia consotensis USBA 355 TaxID=560819 RepID=A0A1Y6CXR6_9PROT|nr:DNA circularization N-terminal domain-containing protein [Tistlia consotensis]SMF77453.1 Mu-like prophage DNA circulation protein [Tistlia consotensis USBA 355]SMF83846.1 Mu-like prophage DNA circulation protein [Tistlia consotensis USBA 355]SNS34706.1 Mu-like prophage DNA circulation protein [Tistlia consotensis]
MSWLETLRPASFRGVPFHVDGGDKDLGRRVVTHEYPLRNQPAHEDLGRKVRSFTVEAILVGDDVTAQLQSLETAVEAAGAGRLVHPVYGELQVVVTAARSRWSTREGRVARLDLTVQEAGELIYPSAAVDTAAEVDSRADTATAASVADFARVFSGASIPDFVADSGAATVRTLAAQAAGILRRFGLQQAASSGSLGAALGTLGATGPADLVDGQQLGTRLAGLFGETSALAGETSPARPGALAVGNALLAMADGLGGDLPAVTASTPSRALEAANQAALVRLARSAAAVEAARSATSIPWDSRDQAIRWRGQAVDSLDRTADSAAEADWDATWGAAVDLRGALARDVAGRAPLLPRIGVVRPAATLPSTALAYQLDGDDLAGLFDRGADLGRRNALRRPGFVPGGDEIEVLLDG